LTRRCAIVLLGALAIVLGTLADRAPSAVPVTLGGYQVLQADFHIHGTIFSAGLLTPWDLVTQAPRQHLDVIAITPHDQLFPSRLAQFFARITGSATITIIGEEVRGAAYHLIALGTSRHVSPLQPAADAIAQIHAQGGFAIAAHPSDVYWPAYDAAAMRALDGAEICHPSIYFNEDRRDDLRAFFQRANGRLTAIGSSDFHGFGRMGVCRTLIFARQRTADAVFEALRARRTVVFDELGNTSYGNAALIQLLAEHPSEATRLRTSTDDPPSSALLRIARLLGIVTMLSVVLFWFRD
jgi:hypothetical protein